MGRPDRLDFPGAYHHVMNRGVRGMDIFRKPHERSQFLQLLDRYSSEYEIRIFAYCLMDTHFHLIVESVTGRLSSFMETFQSEYASWFNLPENREGGHLFKDRFRNELIQAGQYFNEAVRYVLLNPHRAGLVSSGNVVHPWTSMSEWNRDDTVIDWDELFERLTDISPVQFLDFLHQGLTNDIEQPGFKSFLRRVRDLRVIGNDQFLEEMLKKKEKRTRSLDEREGPVNPDEIIQSVLGVWGIQSEKELIRSKYKHKTSWARYAAFYLLRHRSRLSLAKIGTRFNLTGSAVSYGIKKVAESPEENSKLKHILKQWKVNFKFWRLALYKSLIFI